MTPWFMGFVGRMNLSSYIKASYGVEWDGIRLGKDGKNIIGDLHCRHPMC